MARGRTSTAVVSKEITWGGVEAYKGDLRIGLGRTMYITWERPCPGHVHGNELRVSVQPREHQWPLTLDIWKVFWVAAQEKGPQKGNGKARGNVGRRHRPRDAELCRKGKDVPIQREEARFGGVYDAPENQRIGGIVLYISLWIAMHDFVFVDQAHVVQLLGIVAGPIHLVGASEGEEEGHGNAIENVVPGDALAAVPMDSEAAKRRQEGDDGQRPRTCLRRPPSAFTAETRWRAQTAATYDDFMEL